MLKVRKFFFFVSLDHLSNFKTTMYFFSNTLKFFRLVFDKNDNELTAEEEEQRAIAKIKMLGNIKFIGELGKLNLIHESILHKCIKTVGFMSWSNYDPSTRHLSGLFSRCKNASFIRWHLFLLLAVGQEEESPPQGYGWRFGMPLSDNENRGT